MSEDMLTVAEPLEGDAQGTEETSAQELAEGLTQSDGQEEAQNDGGGADGEAPEEAKGDERLEAYRKGTCRWRRTDGRRTRFALFRRTGKCARILRAA